MFIFHITTETEWQKAKLTAEYLPIQFKADGFIHCSKSDQVVRTANKFFPGITGLVLLKIDPNLVKSKIIEENLEGGTELFPHIYGPLPVSVVVDYAPLLETPTKGYSFPAQLIS
ncbi:MAG: DUF952 domain-containing protein [Anaerolineaceae bacterium]